MKFLFLALIAPSMSLAGTAWVNGKEYTCNGSLSIVNNVATCNGQPLDAGSNTGPCHGSTVKKHPNGGGQVDVLATVSPEASIKGTVCGKARIGKSVVVQSGATINGPVELSEGASIGSGSTINGGGKIGKNVIIGRNVTLNGDINLSNTQIADGTVLNGDIDVDGVTFSGGMVCNGEGKIMANPPVGTVQ